MFDWFSNFFGRTARHTLQAHPPHVEAVARHHSPLSSQRFAQAQHSTLFQQSPWVHVAVSRIAEAGALVPLQVLQRQGDRQIAVEGHPLEQLLAQPNPYLSRFELFEATLAYLELTGNAYWFLGGDAQGRPNEIWVLRPDRVSIVPHPTEYIAGYLYEVDGKSIPLEPIEVLHFKRWHPANDYYGLSPLEAARLAVMSDRAMAEWNYNGFGNDHGVPAGIVSIKDAISDSDFERLKQEWRSNYGGKLRKTAFLRGGQIAWQSVGLSHSELDFLQGRQAHRDEILGIFGIPIGLVSENATEANATVAERQFVERTLYPKLVRIAEKISQDLLPFYSGHAIARFDDIRPTDVQARLDQIRTAQAVLTINEIRQQYYHLDPVTWGDVPTALLSMPISTSPEPEPAPTDDPETAAKAIVQELGQWERFVLNRLGQAETRPFKIDAIPDDVAVEIHARLQLAEDASAVRAIFADLCAEFDPQACQGQVASI